VNMTPGKTLGHYRLLEQIGEGGMGVVWKAFDLKLDRNVAVKFMPEGLAGDAGRRALFEREAKAVAALHHPNIVTIYAIEEAQGLRFLTMELIEGDPLTRKIVPGGIGLEPFLKVALPLTAAVAAAHERGIIHRDLKPGNIMIDRAGSVKILDFGLAQVLESAAPQTSLPKTRTATLTEDFGGTILYMSPEQLRGESIDHRTDLFSMAIILYELASGEHPFASRTEADTIAAILKTDPRPASERNPRLPRQLDRILRHCLEKNVRYRMSSAVDLRDELVKLQGEGASAGPEEPPSIAVLPFADMSREKDQAYFCEGIAEEIINALVRVQGLRVASRTASFQFKDQALEPRELGARLHVDTLLEGSVRKSGNRVRITAQLIDVEGGFHLWAESFDRELKDIFEIQEEIGRNIVRSLQVTLSPQEKGALEKPPTRHVQAYDYYLRGRSFYFRYGKRDIEFALQLFSRATELDPGYALAYAGLADCWSYIYLYNERQESVRLQAGAASRRAIELAPDSAQAQASHALAMSIGGQKEEAERGFETAIKLDPNLFEAWYFYARHAFVNGDAEKAVRFFEEAGRVRPEDHQSPLLAAQMYEDLGRPEEARAARRRGVGLVAERIELHPDDARALYMGANGLVALGEREKGLEWARRARDIEPDEPMLLYNLGCIYSLAGEGEEAIDCLERAVARGLTQKGWFEHDSNLDPLRGHPRFKALMDKLG
jgi:serine/threonine protein kinase/tetratricopeptide (TPR) repeat protein